MYKEKENPQEDVLEYLIRKGGDIHEEINTENLHCRDIWIGFEIIIRKDVFKFEN